MAWHRHAKKPRVPLLQPMLIWHWLAGDSGLLVGTKDHAENHIPASWEFCVNCAHFPVKCKNDAVLTWWLNIAYLGSSSGVQDGSGPVEWYERMCTALDTAAGAILRGRDVLFSCNHGKHRSGALAAVFLALVLNISSEEAKKMYFKNRGLYKSVDQGLVNWLWDERLDLDSFIAKVRQRGRRMDRLWELSRLVKEAAEAQEEERRRKRPRSESGSPANPRRRSPERRSSSPGQRSRSSGRSESGSPVNPRRRSPERRPRQSRRSESGSPAEAEAKAQPEAKARPKAQLVPRVKAKARPKAHLRARSRSRSRCRSESSASTNNSVVPGTRNDRAEVPIQGAWTCEACKQLVAKWELYCTKPSCGQRRPLDGWREGDWICWACGNHNWSFRRTCEYRDCPEKLFKKWDWYCPNCGNHNYAKREVCNTNWCRYPRPNSE